MKSEEFNYYYKELMNHPAKPLEFHNLGLAKDLYLELCSRTPGEVICTFHGTPVGQFICSTDRARKRLAKDLKQILFKKRVELDELRSSIDLIEDEFAAAGRRLE